MIKRVNSTDRKRIPRDRVEIEVHDGVPRTFDAVLQLEDSKFPEDAAVVVEATAAGSSVIERFEFGEIGNLQPPQNRQLSELEGQNVFFSVKVIDRTERLGRLLGIAEQIRPVRGGKQTATGRQGIISIEYKDLGQELWQLDLSTFQATLFVNKDIVGFKELLHSDPLMYALIYPGMMRRILSEAILQGGDIEDEVDDWKRDWLHFGRDLHPGRELPPTKQDLQSSEDGTHDWIEDVVKAFCESHQLKDKFAAAHAAREEENQ